SYIIGEFMDGANFGNIHVQSKPYDSRLGPAAPLIVAKYDSSGDAQWVKMVDKADGYFAHAGLSSGLGIAVSAGNDVYITGDFGGYDVPMAFDSFLLKPAKNFFGGIGEDVFVAKLGMGGN